MQSNVIARSAATKQPSRPLQGCVWVASSCFAVLAMTALGNVKYSSLRFAPRYGMVYIVFNVNPRHLWLTKGNGGLCLTTIDTIIVDSG